MNPALLELALKKQRLQLRSAELRRDLAGHAAALAPVLGAADRVAAGVRWIRRHPAVVVAAAAALLAARPRGLLRWLRRGFFAWQAFARVRRWLAGHHARA